MSEKQVDTQEQEITSGGVKIIRALSSPKNSMQLAAILINHPLKQIFNETDRFVDTKD